MLKLLREKKQNFSLTPNIVYIAYSVVFAIVLAFIKIAGDDAALFESSGNTIIDWGKWAYSHYETWSSRQIINFIWAAVLHMGKFVWMLYMAASMFIFLKALELLCDLKAKPKSIVFMLAIASLFPFSILTTAGWIATSTTYFGPIACGLMCLVPAMNAFKGKEGKEKILPFIFYALCLIYGANEEQMMVVILAAYTLVTGYLLLKKIFNWQIIVLFILSVASFVYTMTCPGNFNRGESEYFWFPSYDMLDLIDKSELGISTTLQWLFIDSPILFVFELGILDFCVWKKYKEPIYRIISGFPFVFILSFGPLKNLLSICFPFAGNLLSPFNHYGAFSAGDPAWMLSALRFAILLFVCLCIIATVYLLSNNLKDFYIDLFLILFGTASRVMMGFSPTVYASSSRTFASFIFCLVAVVVRVFYRNEEHVLNTPRSKTVMLYTNCVCIFFGLLNLTILVLTAFA